MVEFCYYVVGSDTSNYPCFGQHRKVYRLNLKCYRTSCSTHYCTIVNRLVHCHLYVCKYLVLLSVEQYDCWNFGYRHSVLYALCVLVHTTVHFRSVFCCHCYYYYHSLFFFGYCKNDIKEITLFHCHCNLI